MLAISTQGASGTFRSVHVIGALMIVGSWFVAAAMLVVCFDTMWGLYYVERHFAEALLFSTAERTRHDDLSTTDGELRPKGAADPEIGAFIADHYQLGRKAFLRCEWQLLALCPILFVLAVIVGGAGVVYWLVPVMF